LIEYSGLKISWLGHDGFLIEGRKILCIDPFKIEKGMVSDLVLVSHSHFDHLSLDDIKKVISTDTIVIAPKDCEPKLNNLKIKEVKIIGVGESLEVIGAMVKAVPAYNINKFSSPGIPFHSEDFGGLGYIIEIDGVKIYHAGDTDLIPEMEDINVDIVFLPVSGTYVMTPEEAAQVTRKIRAKLAIPMHYGTLIGNMSDAEKFKDLAEYRVEILDKE
jgi:L-ascorbate metabolism protein UlaG (beta-lactamase superfamily)